MRLIDADILMAQVENIRNLLRMKTNFGADEICHNFKILVNEMPTVDTERHGHWEFHALSIKNVPTESCSECGEWSYGDNEAYCPCCGAKMDEEIEDEID